MSRTSLSLIVLLGSACSSVQPTEGMLPPMEAQPPATSAFDEVAVPEPEGFVPAEEPAEVDTVGDEVVNEQEGSDIDAARPEVVHEVPSTPGGILDAAQDDLEAAAPALDVPAEQISAVLPVEPAAGLPQSTGAMVLNPGAPSWGVRLVSTLPDTQPPRAVLALGSGEEVVVEPGSILPSERVVVMAVGRDAVQVAYIRPDGDHARIDTVTLQALYQRTGELQPPP